MQYLSSVFPYAEHLYPSLLLAVVCGFVFGALVRPMGITISLVIAAIVLAVLVLMLNLIGIATFYPGDIAGGLTPLVWPAILLVLFTGTAWFSERFHGR